MNGSGIGVMRVELFAIIDTIWGTCFLGVSDDFKFLFISLQFSFRLFIFFDISTFFFLAIFFYFRGFLILLGLVHPDTARIG